MIQPITLANTMIPCIAALIEGVETLLNLLKTYAMTATIITRLGEVGVDDVASYLSLCGSQFDRYATWFRAAHAMFEGILYERDEEQRRDL